MFFLSIFFFFGDRKTPPAPRCDHTAAVHVDRYLLIFGGCSHSTFFNDLHVLDTETVIIHLSLCCYSSCGFFCLCKFVCVRYISSILLMVFSL